MSRGAGSHRASIGSLSMAGEGTARTPNELEMKTEAYEMMMQHFQLRKVDAQSTDNKLWADLNPSTVSNCSTALVVKRKTISDFSTQLGTNFHAVSTESEASAGRSVDEHLLQNTQASKNFIYIGGGEAPRHFSFKTRSQPEQVQDATSNGSAYKSDENASHTHAGASPRGQSAGHTQSNEVEPSSENDTGFVSFRFSLRRYAKRQTRKLRKKTKSLMRKLLTPFSPVGAVEKFRSVVMGIVFALQVIYLPIVPVYTSHGSEEMTMVNIAFEVAFITDFLLHFNMAYYETKALSLVKSRKKIVWNYLKGWFVVDLLSSVPVDLVVFLGISTDDSPQRESDKAHVLFHMLFRIPRLYHILSRLNQFLMLSRKLSAGKDFFAWLFYSRYSHLMRIIRLILLVMVTAHYMACGWHLISGSDPDAPNAVRPGAPMFEKYISDVYYSILLIQGQGESRGTTLHESIFSIFAVLLGSVVLAIVFGNVAILVSNFHASSISYQRKMEVVYATMDKMQLPLELRQRVHQYYDHLWQEYESLDGDIVKFSKELSHTLALEVGLYKYMNLIMRVPMWRACSPDFVTQLVLNLVIRVYLPDDYIIRQGETDAEMYMVNRGVCELTDAIGVFDRPVSSAHSRTDRPRSKRNSGSGISSRRTSGSTTSESDFGELTGMQFRVTPASSKPKQAHRTLFHASATASLANSAIDHDLSDSSESGRDGSDDGDNKRSSRTKKTLEARQKRLRRINPGQSFGEMALLMNYKRTANVRAVTYVEMCILERDKFQQILSRYPEDRKKVLTSMLTSCVEKRETPFSWEEICNLVAKKRHVSVTTVIEDGDNLTTEDIVEVLLDVINCNVIDDSIIFGFQDRATASAVNSNGAHHQGLLRRKRSSRTGLLPLNSSLEALMATASVPMATGVPVGASPALLISETPSVQAVDVVQQQQNTPAHVTQHLRRQSSNQLHTANHQMQMHEQIDELVARMQAMEKGQEAMFALLHKMTTSFTRLENQGYKIRKARSEALLPGSSALYDRSISRQKGVAVVPASQTPLLDGVGFPGKHSHPPLEPIQQSADTRPLCSTSTQSTRGFEGAAAAGVKVLPAGSAPQHLHVPALLRRSSKATSNSRIAAGAGKADDQLDESPAPTAATAAAESAQISRSKQTQQVHQQHQHKQRQHSERLKLVFFKRGSLAALRGASSPQASGAATSVTSLADQLWASNRLADAEATHPSVSSSINYLRRSSLRDLLQEHDDIASIRE